MTDITIYDNEYIANTYNRFPVEIVSGKGSVLTASDGKRYIDMGSGIGVTAFGIADDLWVNAVTAQLNKLQHASNLYYTEPCVKLAKLLCEKTGLKKVFFANSGAEANECAIKTARKYYEDKHDGKSGKIITLTNSFHGRTITTLAATGQEVFHKNFIPLTDGFLYVNSGDVDGLKQAVNENDVAAIMLECIQGEGGVNVVPYDFIKAIDDICKQNDILLIVDEVQTGNGRTGKTYAYMHYDVLPDIVTTAKGLGGGLPIGACIMGEKVKNTLTPSSHGSTYGGNPVCSAGALNVLSRITDDLLNEINEKSNYIINELSSVDGVESVSGMGLMLGIKTTKPAKEVVNECLNLGVLCLTAKDKIRLLPALNIPFETLKQAVNVIKQAILK